MDLYLSPFSAIIHPRNEGLMWALWLMEGDEMGDGPMARLRQGFDSAIKLEFHGAKITSDAGLLVYRKLDDAFSLTASATGQRANVRTVNYTQYSLIALLRQPIYSRLGYYEDLNDAERLRGHRLIWPEAIMRDLECRGSCIAPSVLS